MAESFGRILNLPRNSGPKKENTNCSECQSRCDTAFSSLSSLALDELSEFKRTFSFKKGEILIAAGTRPQGLYCVSKGTVKLETVTSEGESHILRVVKEGGIVGYRCLFADEVSTADAVAVENVDCCFIPQDKIQDLCRKHPDLAMQFLKFISSELRRSEQRLVAAIDKDATERVAEAILFLKDNFSRPTWTRREIAEWAGTTPETVMRTLATFEDQALINQTGRRIEIVNRQALLELANLT